MGGWTMTGPACEGILSPRRSSRSQRSTLVCETYEGSVRMTHGLPARRVVIARPTSNVPRRRSTRLSSHRPRPGLRHRCPGHWLLALWASACAEHVLHLESMQPSDRRPRDAIEQIRAWSRGEVTMSRSRSAGGHAMAAARGLTGAPRHAAFAAGQTALVAHLAAHCAGRCSTLMPSVPRATTDDRRAGCMMAM